MEQEKIGASEVTNETRGKDYYVPQFPNPYPEPSWKEITDFKYKSPLVLCRSIEAVQYRGGKEDADYIVALPYTITFKLDGEARSLTVPKGMLTDLASVPWWARWAVSRVGPHLEAAIVHDFLYIAWQNLENYAAKEEDQKFADALMDKAMEKAKVANFKRKLISTALWLGGWNVYKKKDQPPLYDQLLNDTPNEREALPPEPAPAADETTQAPSRIRSCRSD